MQQGQIDRVVDEVIGAYSARNLGLWLANFADLRDEFGQWSGLVRASAEAYMRDWRPDRQALLDRVRHRKGENTEAIDFDDVIEELLPLARDGFAKDLSAKQVPHRVVEQAKGVILAEPPIQQWRM